MGSFLVMKLVLVGVLLTAGALLSPAVSRAQVTTNITSSGLGTTVTQAGTTWNLTGGTRPGNGANLFHSFGLFNVGEGNSANFLNNTGLATANILGRVTGGQTSIIFGTIQTTGFGAANLFLINPAGWIFGPTASLNVGGSFHVSTADYIRFSDEARFYADLSQNSVLTSAPPAAFGFLGPMATRISIEGSFLQVPEGQTLSVVGGDAPFPGEAETGLKISGATVGAPGGRIQIASVASAGEVSLNGDFNTNSFSSLGHIDILENALIGATDAEGNGGGMVLIRGGSLIVDGSQILAHTLGDVEGTRLIDIKVTGDVVVSNGALISTATVTEEPAGDITMSAKSLALLGGGNIATTDSGFGVGQAGTVAVTATDSVTISGPGSGIFSNAFSSGDGNHVTLSAPSLTLDDGGSVFSGTFVEGRGGDIVMEVENLSVAGGSTITSVAAGSGPGGKLTLTASDSATLSGPGSGIFIAGSSDGPSGNMLANFGKLTVTDGAGIQSGFIFGEAGNVEIIATDAIVLSNGGGILSAAISQIGSVTIHAPTLVIDNGFLSTSTVGTAQAGNILLDVGTLTLKLGGQVTSSSDLFATGDGGNLTVTANSVSISGTAPGGVPSSPFSSDPSSGIFSTTAGTGNAGQITVSTPTLTMADGGKISVATSGTGNAGNVFLNVSNSTLTSGARVDSSTTSEGQGGNVTLSAAESISISGQGTGLFSTASSTGNAGQIMVAAPGSTPVPTLTIGDNGKISVATSLKESGAGSAGSVSLKANTFSLTGGAQVVSSTTGAGQGGSVTVSAPGSLSVSGSGTAASGLLSTAESTGSAGQIAVTTPALTMGDGGTISVATSDIGNAGSISLNVSNFTQTGGAQVVSSTTGDGAGGTLALTAGELVSISGAGSGLFSTASSTGNAGQITVSAPALAPVPTLTMADGGKISVATSGAGSAGSILLNATILL